MVNKKPKYSYYTTALEVLDNVSLSGKTILITGTTTGIGRETARALALKGAHVVMANRNVALSEELRNEIFKETTNRKIDIIQLDLSSLASVKRAAEDFLAKKWPLHVLILNAGVNWSPNSATKDGYESTFGVNHLGHFYLTYLLLEKLRESRPSRIVVVSSYLHSKTGINRNATVEEKLNKLIPSPSNNIGMVDAWKLYNISKLCNVLFAFKLHRLEHENGINMFALHPGVITDTALTRNSQTFSKIFKFVSKPFVKTLEQGAATTVYCAASPHTQNESGRYYTNCADYEKDLDKALARDERLQDLLWSKSLEFINQFERSI